MDKKESPKSPLTYRDAGVDIDAGDALVTDIKPFAKKTMRAGANLIWADLADYLTSRLQDDPVLVAATDGVGTKLELAQQANMHHGWASIWWPCAPMTSLHKGRCRCSFWIILPLASLARKLPLKW